MTILDLVEKLYVPTLGINCDRDNPFSSLERGGQ